MGTYILDVNHHVVEVDTKTWAVWSASLENRRIAYTQIADKCYVSTVFLGLDHRHDNKGPPLLFETMIFGGPLDGEMWRYSSWDDAEVGHDVAVRKVKAKLEAENGD